MGARTWQEPDRYFIIRRIFPMRARINFWFGSLSRCGSDVCHTIFLDLFYRMADPDWHSLLLQWIPRAVKRADGCRAPSTPGRLGYIAVQG